MVRVQSLILTGIALASLSASLAAQVQKRGPFKRMQVSGYATLDLGTGTYTRGPSVNDRGGTTVADLQNLDFFNPSTFVTVDTAGCTWFNAASKGVGANQGVGGGAHQHGPPPGSDLMSSILFFYCSGALDVSSGGPGGAVTLGFYEGYTAFGGAPTTVATLVNLTGMPAATAPGGFFSGARCYGMNVQFSPMVAFADSHFIGYSWEFVNAGAGGVLGDTFPFMACVVSCSGISIVNGSAGGIGTATGFGEDGQGMLDIMDRFCSAPAPLTSGTFTFSTSAPFAPLTMTSIGMEIREAAALATTDVDYNDAAPIQNLDTLTATPATIGNTWTATFARAGGGSGRFQIRVWRDRLGGNGIAPDSGSVPWPTGTGGRKMCGGVYLSSLPPGQSVAGSPVTPTLAFSGGVGTAIEPIPLDFIFCGLHFACQARSGTGPAGGGTPRLSSAVEGTIGTF